MWRKVAQKVDLSLHDIACTARSVMGNENRDVAGNGVPATKGVQ